MSTLDDILEQIGEFGFFQKQTLFVLCLLAAAFNPVYVGIIFFGFTPEHWCFSPGVAELSQQCGWSLEEQLNLTVPEWHSHGAGFSSCCKRYEVDWNATGVSCTDPLDSLMGNRTTVPLDLCQDGLVYDSPGTSLVTEFNLVCEDSWKLDLFKSCVNAGFLIGSMSTGYIADRFGCKLCLLAPIFINAASGVLMAFAPSYTWAVIFYLIQGLVSKEGWLTGYVLIAEFVGSNYQRAVGITYQLAFSLGLLALTALVYVLLHWRWFQLTVALPNFFLLLYYWCLPESPRWLIAQKQNDKAMEVKYIAKGNKKKLPLSFQRISSKREDREKLKQFLDLIRTPQIRKHIFILMHSWVWLHLHSGFCPGSQAHQGVIMHMGIAAGNVELDFLHSALVEFPAAFILMLMLDRIGRCYPWPMANLIAGGACLLTVLVPDTLYSLKMAAACLGRMGITMCYKIICVVNPELYPTFLRNLGVLVCSSLCDLVGIITPFLVDGLAELRQELPLLIFAVISLIDSGLVLLLPEMKGKSLPETIEDAENLHR
ncbi:S22A2 protein, partial [Indicator maculatus]|nr:S22A2 protein [Indicator maculatus]